MFVVNMIKQLYLKGTQPSHSVFRHPGSDSVSYVIINILRFSKLSLLTNISDNIWTVVTL